MIVFDNDVLVRLLRDPPDPAVVEHVRQYSNHEWTIPSLVAFEFYRGYDSRAEMTRVQTRLANTLDRIVDFTDATALEAAYLDERLSTQDVSLDPVDLLNLATAHLEGGTFVTHNETDFDKPPVRELTNVDVIRT